MKRILFSKKINEFVDSNTELLISDEKLIINSEKFIKDNKEINRDDIIKQSLVNFLGYKQYEFNED